MPRKSPFTIALMNVERTELLARSRRYTSLYRDVIRAKIVLMAEQGLDNDAIAARLDTARQIVSKWRQRFHVQRHRCWIFPRDPAFALKAGRVLDLYQRRWCGAALGPRDYVLCADEKTSIQARRRKHPSTPPQPGRPIRVEHEYARAGALAYIAAWDVHR